jgi:hypothetical protein
VTSVFEATGDSQQQKPGAALTRKTLIAKIGAVFQVQAARSATAAAA